MIVTQSIISGKMRTSKKLQIFSIAFFSAIILFIWIYDIVLLSHPNKYREGTVVYEVNIYTLAVLSLVLSLLFLFYGVYLYRVVKNIQTQVNSNSNKARSVSIPID